MRLHMIVAQYKESYPGELMPNVVDVWDEFVMDDNPDGYRKELKRHEALVGTEYSGVRELVVTLPDEVVTDLFAVPELPTLWRQVNR